MTVLVAISPGHTSVALESRDFEVVYKEHCDAIWRFVERLGVPARHLEDATQDTFLIAHRQLASFRGASSVRTWLHGIALRVAKDYRRTETRKGGWQPLSDRLADERRSPDEAAAQREELELVLKLLEGLDEPQRTTFVLVELQGFTAPEVAEVTGANVNTVSTRLRAARQRFNELVDASGGSR